ncbi:MAG: hypothetical protein R3D69_15360 [Xanthobacteraceae bacterium]
MRQASLCDSARLADIPLRQELPPRRGIGPALFHVEVSMGRYLLLWLLGVPIPILLLIWLFGGLN